MDHDVVRIGGAPSVRALDKEGPRRFKRWGRSLSRSNSFGLLGQAVLHDPVPSETHFEIDGVQNLAAKDTNGFRIPSRVGRSEHDNAELAVFW
jgi:hypothetical protein